jgi:uncharacterized protein YukE
VALNVDLEAMVSSAGHVTVQGEDLAAGHLATDNRMASAQVGWQGLSATAMSAKLAAWGNVSAALLERISDHAQGLHRCAVGFATHEEQSRTALQALVAGNGDADTS